MEHYRTLVLNKSFSVVSIISWQRAVSLLYSKSAERILHWDVEMSDFSYCEYDTTVSNYDRRFVWRIPSIIRLTKSNVFPRRYEPRFSKINVFYRDNFECQYCGFKQLREKEKGKNPGIFLTMDHVVPISKGGKTTFDNCVCACSRCNLQKGDKSHEEINLRLKKKPSNPSYETLVRRRMIKRRFPKAWNSYIKF